MKVGSGVHLDLSGEYPTKLRYRYLIPAPVDRTSASASLYKHT